MNLNEVSNRGDRCRVVLYSIATLLVMMTASGCCHIQNGDPKPPSFVRIENINGEFTTEEVVAGGRVAANMKLHRDGDAISIMNKQAVTIDVTGFDAERSIIITEVMPGNDEIIMRVARKSSAEIRLTSKCQTVTIGNTDVLPPIRLCAGLNIEQVIITPLCDGINSVIGYEIRYGSTDAGCRGQARQGQERFRKCKEQKTSRPLSGPCRYFGVGC